MGCYIKGHLYRAFRVKALAYVAIAMSLVFHGLVAASSSSESDARPTITFVCDARPDQSTHQVALTFLTEIFDGLGFRYIQKHAGIEDAISQLRHGEVDGDCGRIAGFTENSGLSNYVPIGPAYTQVVFSRWYIHSQDKPRNELKVGYTANALMLKSHLLKMGYRELYPIVTEVGSIERLRSGDFDLVVHYDRAMDFLKTSNDYLDVKRTDSFVTLPIRPYMTKATVAKLGRKWDLIAKDIFQKRLEKSSIADLPKRHEGKIIFSCSLHAESSFYKELDLRYTHLFGELGYSYQQVSMPRTREAHELSWGNIDGVCGRTKSHAQHQPNSVRVGIPIYKSKVRVWSLSAVDDIHSSEDLTPDRRVAYVRGTTFLKNTLKGYDGQLVPVFDMMTGIKMLVANRIDYLVGFDAIYQNLVADTIFQAPIYGVGSLDSVDVYPFLHQSRSDVAERLEALLRRESNAQ